MLGKASAISLSCRYLTKCKLTSNMVSTYNYFILVIGKLSKRPFLKKIIIENISRLISSQNLTELTTTKKSNNLKSNLKFFENINFKSVTLQVLSSALTVTVHFRILWFQSIPRCYHLTFFSAVNKVNLKTGNG